MKILITSDIHRNIKRLNEIIKKHPNTDYHLDAGDSNFTTEFLEDKKIISVKGNTDFFSDLPLKRLIEIEGKKILIVHGHTLRVKRNLKLLYSYAKSLKVDICIYGHTHRQLVEEIDGITFINPGSVLDKRYVILKDFKMKLF